jgi:hypothetical protein
MQTLHTSRLRFIWLALLVVTMAGCETMSKEECLSADWYQTGYQDGRDGHDRARIESITESCAKTSVNPDREQYFLGRDRGLREYCTPAHGFDLGKNGTSYKRVCPPKSAGYFEKAYNEGKRIYDARQKLRQLEVKRHQLEEKLSTEKDYKEKKHLRDELEELDSRLDFARNQLRRIERESRQWD